MRSFWEGKNVLVTGHTGFKGSWLSLWLRQLGADVYGYALQPDTNPSLFEQLNLEKNINHFIGDIRDQSCLEKRIYTVSPDIVFHLAAQPLVRRSYYEPSLTWETNVIGTINLLESLRKYDKPCYVVIVTTDKVYENHEWVYAYRETDRLGGYDPYSASKTATELVVDSWRNSFFLGVSSIKIATARAGNVIAGGDWSENRIIPDLAKALARNNAIVVRNPHSVRPWQHVLEPLSGYLRLAQSLSEIDNYDIQSAFNFGPGNESCRTVKELVEEALKYWEGTWEQDLESEAPHEAAVLSLSIDKARALLPWQPKWTFVECVEHTLSWYRSFYDGVDPIEISLEQIKLFNQ